MSIKLADIRIDGGTQPRAQINEAIVGEYAEALTAGEKLPPVTVFHDGADHWLADGFHRFHAHRKIGALDIDADIRAGTKRDAILFSVGANDTHGLRRTNADKRNAVETLLRDAEWSGWSDNKIAKACAVDHKTVAVIRASILGNSQDAVPAVRTVERAGKVYQQNTANIGKTQAAKGKRSIAPEPEYATAANDELAEARHAITDLAAENEALHDRLAVEVMDASEEEKLLASETISDLRARVRTLEAENDAVKSQRDGYLRENAELKKQVSYWRKQAEKAA